MNRAPTKVSVPPLRYQHGSGVKKHKYKRVTKSNKRTLYKNVVEITHSKRFMYDTDSW